MEKTLDFKPKFFAAIRNYDRKTFMADLMAGVIVGIVALPLAIAFGIASGVSPEKGIITAIVAGLMISLFGGSKVQIGGPTGAFIVIVYGIIQQYGMQGLTVNVIAIDSIYTPIRNVKYTVEPYRVEQKTDYDKLVLEIQTDGSIHPKDALKEAAKILIYHFMLFSDEKITLENTDTETNQEFDEEVLHMRQLLKTKLVDMNLSVRALNCLKAADVETLGDLVQYNKTDLLKFRNFGKKSLTELDDLLESLNLSFGTDIAKYKLDRE